jgi:hypothetical protein
MTAPRLPLYAPPLPARKGLLVGLLALLAACGGAAEGTKSTVDDGGGDGGEAPAPEPLTFSLTGPGSGAIVAEDRVEVTGAWAGGTNPSVTVNGVDVGPEGEFRVESHHDDVPWPDSPLWPILGDAHDDTGVWHRGRFTLLHGDSAPADAPVPSGLTLRLTDELLLDLGPQVDAIVAGLDLESLLASEDPVFELLGAEVYIDGLALGPVSAELDFRSTGLNYTLRASDLSILLLLDFGFLGTTDSEVTASAIEITGDLVIGTDAGGLTATPANTAVSVTDLEVFGITDSFGLVDTLLGDTLATTIEEQLVDALSGLLEAQESLRVLEFEGVQILSDFTSAQHDEQGVNIFAASRVELAEGGATGDRLTTDISYSPPTTTVSPAGAPYQAALLLDDDLLSALGAALPATGLLNQTVEGDALGSLSLDTTLLGGLIPGFDQLPPGQAVSLVTRPTVALAGAPGRDGVAAELHVGGLEIDFVTDADGDGEGDVVMTVVVDAVVGITAGTEALIDIVLVDSAATLTSTVLDTSPELVEPGLSTLISVAVPSLVGGLLGDALAFDLGGIAITVVDGGAVDDRAGLFLDLDLSGLEL